MAGNDTYKITVDYVVPLFKRVAKAYIKGTLLRRKQLVIVLVLVASLLSLLLISLIGMMLLHGCPLPRLSGFTIRLIETVVLLALLVPVLYGFLYWRIVQGCDRLGRKMTNRTVQFSFDREGMRFESDVATSEIKWRLFHKLQTEKDIWLLFPTPASFYILPTDLMSAEMQGFILDRIREEKIRLYQV